MFTFSHAAKILNMDNDKLKVAFRDSATIKNRRNS